MVPAFARTARRLPDAPDRLPRERRASASRSRAGREARRRRPLDRDHLRADARTRSRARTGPRRSRAVGRATARGAVRQRSRASAADVRGDAGRRAVLADLARVFAGIDRLRQAASYARCAEAGCGVRRRTRAVRACARRRVAGRCGADRRTRRRCRCRRRRKGPRGAALALARHRPAHDRRDPRGGRPRSSREDPVHVRLHEAAEGRADHAPDAVQQPADAAPDDARTDARTAGAGRLAAVESHVRRQSQPRHRAIQRRHAVYRRRPPDAGPLRRNRAQPARDRADDLLQRAERLGRTDGRARTRCRCATRSSRA